MDGVCSPVPELVGVRALGELGCAMSLVVSVDGAYGYGYVGYDFLYGEGLVGGYLGDRMVLRLPIRVDFVVSCVTCADRPDVPVGIEWTEA